MKYLALLLVVYLTCLSVIATPTDIHPDVLLDEAAILEYFNDLEEETIRQSLNNESLTAFHLKQQLIENLGDPENWGRLSRTELAPYLKDQMLTYEGVINALRSIRRVENHQGNTQVSLAKLGDEEAFEEILDELDSDNPSKVRDALGKLERISNRQSIIVAASFLYDDREFYPGSYVIPATVSGAASMALSPVVLGHRTLLASHPENVEKARRWWELHKHEYLDEPEVEAPEEEIIVEDFEPIETPAETLIKPVAKPRAEPKQAPATWPYWVVGLLALTLVLYLVNRRK